MTKEKKDVELEKRIQQTEHPKKRNFLELWRESMGNVTECSRAVGIGRTTYYDWLDKDPVFAQLLAEVEGELNDEMRQALIEKGRSGDLGAIIFYLKNRHPDFKQHKAAGINVEEMKVIIMRGDSPAPNDKT